jgi:hypothetical protein
MPSEHWVAKWHDLAAGFFQHAAHLLVVGTTFPFMLFDQAHHVQQRFHAKGLLIGRRERLNVGLAVGSPPQLDRRIDDVHLGAHWHTPED